MAGEVVAHPLDELREGELASFARVGARALAARMPYADGSRADSLHSGQGLEFLDYREYVPGDDVRTVDWRASSRRARPVVRRFIHTGSSDWYVCLDHSASMGCGEHKWPHALQLTAAFTYLLLYLGNRVGVVLFSDGARPLCPPGRGHSQYARILRRLRASTARTRDGGSDLGSLCKELPTRSSLVLVSDFLKPDGMRGALRRLIRPNRAIHSLQVLAPNETALPEAGRSVLEDVETRELVTPESTLEAQAVAEQALQDLVARLAAFCASHRVAYTLSHSHRPWRDALARHLLQHRGYDA